MLVIPAIDLKGGRVVRLAQGAADKETVYSDPPSEVARRWEAAGAELIHIVDLDGALQGEPKNLEAVAGIVRSVKAKVELGGGIRSMAAIERVLDLGVSKVCIGTKALDQKFLADISRSPFLEMVVIGIDAKDGIVRAKGWTEDTGIEVVELIKEVARFGITTVDFTDISRDGMMKGPNIAGLRRFLAVTKLDVIAAGGVTTIEDVKKLKALEGEGLKGMIIGKALYEGRIDLAEAIKICLQKG
jgi:phosphoribosylformimino-5-aminoimidazole carboxamide ribotide isomerase